LIDASALRLLNNRAINIAGHPLPQPPDRSDIRNLQRLEQQLPDTSDAGVTSPV
jgi:hypothetical protein